MTSADNPHNEMNTIIHHGLRRDLQRMEQVAGQPLGEEQRRQLAEHTLWMLHHLHHHHVGEDEGVWPMVLAKRPDLQPLVDQMESEHETLSAASDGLRAAAEALATDRSDAVREAYGDDVRAMQAATLPHLDHEEQEAMPLVLETLDDEDWRYLERHYFRKGVSLPQAGQLFMWLLDDLDQRRARMVRQQVPGPLMWIMERLLGGRYDRAAALRWGALAGTRT